MFKVGQKLMYTADNKLFKNLKFEVVDVKDLNGEKVVTIAVLRNGKKTNAYTMVTESVLSKFYSPEDVKIEEKQYTRDYYIGYADGIEESLKEVESSDQAFINGIKEGITMVCERFREIANEVIDDIDGIVERKLNEE